MANRIYFDHHATTPVDARVLAEMLPYFSEEFGNAASSSHSYGWAARDAVERARHQVADLVGASPQEIIFTSGATESDNLALKGAAHGLRHLGQHLITCVTEHPAILDTARRLETDGFETTYLPVDNHGSIDVDQLEASIRPETILISLMTANNEIGTTHPTAEIGQIAREHGVLLHVDAAQSLAYLPTDVITDRVDLLSISAHKMYGPKGVGALFVRRRPEIPMVAEMDGGGHERGLRSGTLNVPAIVGLGKAAAIAKAEMAGETERLRKLRDRLYEIVTSTIDHIQVNGHPTQRLPGNLHLTIDGVDAQALISRLGNIAISTGSACSSATPQPSHVLRAIGIDGDRGFSSIRIGLGRNNTESEIREFCEVLTEQVDILRTTAAHHHEIPA